MKWTALAILGVCLTAILIAFIIVSPALIAFGGLPFMFYVYHKGNKTRTENKKSKETVDWDKIEQLSKQYSSKK